MKRRCVVLAGLLSMLTGCRDLTVPPKQDGRVSGIAVFTDSTGQTRPGARAVAVVAGTSLRTTATSEGAFALEPITSPIGTLVLSFDVDGDGVDDLARSLDFEAWKIGPNHETALGQVPLQSTATLRGIVKLSGATTSAGTDVFVPGLSLAARTTDTGAFVLTGVPVGTITLVASHAGYAAARVAGLQTQSGQLFTLTELTLEPEVVAPTQVSGQLELVPPSDLTKVRVSAETATSSVNLPVGSDGHFQGPVAPGRATLVARADGYSNAVLPNLVISGPQFDVGVLRLSPGTFTFDAGTPHPPIDSGCGDTIVGAAEACDDGNSASGDGCSSACALEVQTGGGASCLASTPLQLVPVAGGRLKAALQIVPHSEPRINSVCVLGTMQVYRLTLPFPATVATNGPGNVSLRGTLCEELLCGLTPISPVLPAGDVFLLFEEGAATAPAEVLVTPFKGGPFCGDGVVDANEECDDGNPANGDWCTATCTQRGVEASSTCLFAPLLTLQPSSDRSLVAMFDTSQGVGNDTTFAPSCQPNQLRTQFVRVELPAAGSIRVDVNPSNSLVDWAISVFSGPCVAHTELFCSNANTERVAEVLSTDLDAGVYTLLISGVGTERQLTGRFSFVPK